MMSPLTPEFIAAYQEAICVMDGAIAKFESTTGRHVDSAELIRLDITQIQDAEPQTLRTFEIRFAPAPGELQKPPANVFFSFAKHIKDKLS